MKRIQPSSADQSENVSGMRSPSLGRAHHEELARPATFLRDPGGLDAHLEDGVGKLPCVHDPKHDGPPWTGL